MDASGMKCHRTRKTYSMPSHDDTHFNKYTEENEAKHKILNLSLIHLISIYNR